MAISPYNEYNLILADEFGEIYLWDLRKLKKPYCKYQAHSLAIPQVKFNPHDEKLFATVGSDSYFHLWQLNDNNEEPICLKSFQTHHLPITTFDFSVHDFGLVADSSSDYSLFLWNFLDTKIDSKL